MVAYRVEKGCGVSRSSRSMIIAAAKFRVTSDSQQEHTFIMYGIAKFVRGEHDLHLMDHLEALKLQCEGFSICAAVSESTPLHDSTHPSTKILKSKIQDAERNVYALNMLTNPNLPVPTRRFLKPLKPRRRIRHLNTIMQRVRIMLL